MNRWREAVERYAGAVPSPFAVYKAPIFGGGSLLPFMLGIASFEMPELDTLRSPDDLQAHLDAIDVRVQEINADAEGLPFNEEQRSEWAALVDRRKDVVARKTELDARLAYIESMASASPQHVETTVMPSTRRQVSRIPANVHDLAAYRENVRSVDELPALYAEGGRKAIDGLDVDDASKEHLAKLLRTVDNPGALGARIAALSNPTYERAFLKMVTGRELTTSERAAMAVYTNSGADGGYAVPVTLDPTLILTGTAYVNDIRRIARVETITTKEWQGVATEGISVSRVAENTAVTESNVTLTQPRAVPTAVKGLIKFSIELDQDWGTLQRELGRLFARAKANEEAVSFITGTGDGITAPEGIERIADSSIVWTEASGNFGLEDVYAVKGDLPVQYRQNAKWLADDSIYSRIRQFDTTGSSNAWSESLRDDRPGLLLGKPAFEASAMDDTLANGNDILIIGDFEFFLIVDRVGMSIELIPHMFNGDGNPTGTRGLWAMWRNTSLILNDDAFRKLRVGEGS